MNLIFPRSAKGIAALYDGKTVVTLPSGDAEVNASLKLSRTAVGHGVDLGTFTQDVYDARQIEFVVRFRS